MRLFFLLSFSISLIACKSRYIPKVRVWQPSAYETAMSLDTTFKFTEMIRDKYGYNNHISLTIPYNVLESTITGQIEFYANINFKGEVENLNILSMFIRRNGKKFIHYDNKIDKAEPKIKSYYTIKNYIQASANSFEKIASKIASDTLHPTYCVLSIK